MFKKSLMLAALVGVMAPMVAHSWTLTTRVNSAGGQLQVGSYAPQTRVSAVMRNYTTTPQAVAITASTPGWKISRIFKNGVAVTPTTPTSHSMSVVEAATQQVIGVSFAKVLYPVKVTAAPGGMVTTPGLRNLQAGTQKSFVFTPYGNRSLVTIDGLSALTEGTDYTISSTLPADPRASVVLTVNVNKAATLKGIFLGVDADAGAPQTVLVNTAVTLNGSAVNYAGTGTLTYSWTKIAGPAAVALTGANTAAPTFTPTVLGKYTFKLTASNGSTSDYAFTSVTVASSIADAGAKACGTCHGQQYTDWTGSTHGSTATFCAGCHVGADTGAHPGTTATNATCLSASCHGKTSLVKTITTSGASETVPLYVNKAAFATTTHGNKSCSSCHTDIDLDMSAGVNGHANVPKTYGGWSRFSKNDINVDHVPWGQSNLNADTPRTRNYFTAASRSCTTCHTKQSDFGNSAHATIFKQKEAHIDSTLTAIATVCEGKSTTIGEDWANGNCNRCHATCGTCHFKSTIALKGAYPVADKWDEIQRTDKIGGASVPDNLSEYQLIWTDNVANHDFRPKAYFATDPEGVCNACHTGYYRPASNAYYWKEGADHTADTTVCDESAGANWARVKGTNVRRHPQATELKFSGYTSLSISGGENTAHGNMTCNDCHGTASGKSGDIHKLPGEEYDWATKGDIQCTDCHISVQHENPWVSAHITGGFEKGTKVACIGCHSYGMARDFALADGAVFDNLSTTHNVFIDPVTKEVRPVVRKNGHAIAWYSHNWQSVNPSAGKLDPDGDCAKKCHYYGNKVGAGYEKGITEAGKHGITAASCVSCHNGGASDPIGDSRVVENSAGNNVAAGSNECLLCHTGLASWADTPHTQKAKIGKEYVNGYNTNPANYTGAARWITDNRETYVHPKNKNADGSVKDATKLGVRAIMTETPTVTYSDQTFGVDDITVVIGSNHKQAYGVWMPGYGNKILNIRYNNLDPGLTPSMGDRTDERVWEGSCIGCHVTGYDKAAVPGTYKDAATSYDLSPYMNDLRIGCVACHGSEVDATGHAKKVSNLTQDQQIDICGRCHGNWNSTVPGTTARKDVTEFEAGDSLVNLLSPAYNGGVDRLKRPTWGTAIKEFSASGAAADDHEQWYDFKIGKHYGKSFNGKPVTCASCHDPHKKSAEPGRIYGRLILKGSYDLTNGTSTVCVGCHPTATFVVDGKTVTKKGKTGALNPHTGKAYGVGVEPTPLAGSLWPWEVQ